jgi:hypothetical protein
MGGRCEICEVLVGMFGGGNGGNSGLLVEMHTQGQQGQMDVIPAPVLRCTSEQDARVHHPPLAAGFCRTLNTIGRPAGHVYPRTRRWAFMIFLDGRPLPVPNDIPPFISSLFLNEILSTAFTVFPRFPVRYPCFN